MPYTPIACLIGGFILGWLLARLMMTPRKPKYGTLIISQDDNEGCRSEKTYAGWSDEGAIDDFVKTEIADGFLHEFLPEWTEALTELAARTAMGETMSAQDPSVQGTITITRKPSPYW